MELSAESGLGWMRRQDIVYNHLSAIEKVWRITRLTTSTSRNVSFGSQSLFRVSRQTAPVDSSTLGWNIRVLNVAFGGFLG